MERRRDAFLAAADYALQRARPRGRARRRPQRDQLRRRPRPPGRQQHRARPRRARARDARAPTPPAGAPGQACAALAQAGGAARAASRVEIRPMSATTPAPCSPTRAGGGRGGVQASSASAAQRLYSAAGHDAQNLAAVTDSGMIFIPSQGGRSHRVDETSDGDAIERGANVLLRTLLDLAAADRAPERRAAAARAAALADAAEPARVPSSCTVDSRAPPRPAAVAGDRRRSRWAGARGTGRCPPLVARSDLDRSILYLYSIITWASRRSSRVVVFGRARLDPRCASASGPGRPRCRARSAATPRWRSPGRSRPRSSCSSSPSRPSR